jgi:hypothetical protein
MLPPHKLESIVGWFIPPVCREEVLGDLCERYRSPAQYIFEALRVVPCVILGRIRRTTDLQLVLIDALLLYAAFLVSAFWVDQNFLHSDRGLLKLFLAALLALFNEVLHAAWRTPGSRTVAVPAFFLGAIASLFVLWIVPIQILLLGGFSGLLLTASVRALWPIEKTYASPVPYPVSSSSASVAWAKKIGGLGLLAAFCLIVIATEGLKVGSMAVAIGIAAVIIASLQKG